MKFLLLIIPLFICVSSFGMNPEDLPRDDYIQAKIALESNQSQKLIQGDPLTFYINVDENLSPYFFYSLKNKKIMESIFIIGSPRQVAKGKYLVKGIAANPLSINSEKLESINGKEIQFKNIDFDIAAEAEMNKVKEFTVLDQLWARLKNWKTILIVILSILIIIAGYFFLILYPKRKERNRKRIEYNQRINDWRKIVEELPSQDAFEELYLQRKKISEDMKKGRSLLEDLCREINGLQYQENWQDKINEDLYRLTERLKKQVEFNQHD